MADVGRLLETMHPMREPPAPEPVLPYLVLLACGCLAAVALLALLGVLRRRGTAYRAEAEATLTGARHLSPADRLAVQAKLLRRVTRGLAGDAAARAEGAAWLEGLDRLFGTQFFTHGAGRVYGEAIYRRPGEVDLDALDRTLLELIGRARPGATS